MVLIFSEQKPAAVAPLACVICQEERVPTYVSAVSLYADGTQAVACTKHLPHQTRQWVLAWIAFETVQRFGDREAA